MDNYEEQDLSSEIENVTEETPAEPQAEIAQEQAAPAEAQEVSAQAEPAGEETREDSCYRGIGAGRKETTGTSFAAPEAPREAAAPHYEEPYRPRQEAPQEQPKAPKKKVPGVWKKVVAAAAALAVVAGSCTLTAHLVNQRWEEKTKELAESFSRQLEELQAQVEAMSPQKTGVSVSGSYNAADYAAGYSAGQVYAQNVQSVVLIECSVTSSYYGQTVTGTSAGSGFILTEDGYVVTNYHVVEGASTVVVSLVDGTDYAARVVGYDSTNDVAVLKVNATGLDPVTIGSSSDLIVGDQVVAIGNPLGELTSTLTVGYVSAKERDVTTDGTIINMIQTDCAINSGNSGGPLFNMKGEVVGITTAKYSGSSSSGASIEGIGFAIPMDDVADIIQQLKDYGYVKSAYMGVVVRNMDSDTAAIYSLPVGAYVDSVEEGGAAQLAGIQAKDIIIAVDSTSIETISDLTRALRGYEPGDVAMVTIYRGGQTLVKAVELQERPRDLDTGSTGTQESVPEGGFEGWNEYDSPYSGNGNGG